MVKILSNLIPPKAPSKTTILLPKLIIFLIYFSMFAANSPMPRTALASTYPLYMQTQEDQARKELVSAAQLPPSSSVRETLL